MAPTSTMVSDVKESSWGLEWSVHACPKDMARELAQVFPGEDLDGLLLVPTCQRSQLDLVRTGEEIEAEKDLLLERFMAWAQRVCAGLVEQGCWADYIDPCSGLPMLHRQGSCVYNEVEALCCLMQYRTANAGCCKVVLHPRWGSSVYPATLLTKAPVETLLQVVAALEQQQPPPQQQHEPPVAV